MNPIAEFRHFLWLLMVLFFGGLGAWQIIKSGASLFLLFFPAWYIGYAIYCYSKKDE